MGFGRWVVGGLIGAAAGIAIWVLVGHFTHYEVGWIAWGIGFLVGLGVRYAAHLGGEDASLAKGLFSAALALVAVLTAKFLVFSLLVAGTAKDRETVQQLGKEMLAKDGPAIAVIAREVAAQEAKQGKAVAWPAGVTAATAKKESDFPEKIWSTAMLRWLDTGTPQEREQKKQRWMTSMTLSEIGKRPPDFGDSFSPFDLLWLGLAVVTAFRVGTGSYGSD